MATLQLKVKDGRFVESNGVNVKAFSPTYVEGNEWKCEIKKDGAIFCFAQKTVGETMYSMRYTITNGWTKLTLKIGDQKPKILKNFRLREPNIAGVIGLPGGDITKRRPYFREAGFQELLERYGLTAVRFEYANAVYTLHEQFQNGETIFKEEIEITDGNQECIFEETIESSQGEILAMKRCVEVTDAKWVIKKVQKVDGGIHRILITKQNPKTMRGLPQKSKN